MATVALETLDTDPARVELKERLGFHDPLIYAIALALRDDTIAGGFADRLYADSLAHTLAVHLLRNHAVFLHQLPPLSYDLSGPMLRRVMDYIQANLAQELTLAELANVVYLSPYHLARLFKRATGQSLHQYVIAQRVAAAQRLISAGQLPQAEIARQVGFADQSHMIRHFKRLLGVSPATFAHSARIF
jgi:AraC family transcriptional regulator